MHYGKKNTSETLKFGGIINKRYIFKRRMIKYLQQYFSRQVTYPNDIHSFR
jgi:hypothetical protein